MKHFIRVSFTIGCLLATSSTLLSQGFIFNQLFQPSIRLNAFHGSEVIQGLAELRAPSVGEERPTVQFFAEFFRKVRPLQLRDILNDIGPQLFAKVVEAKTRHCL